MTSTQRICRASLLKEKQLTSIHIKIHSPQSSQPTMDGSRKWYPFLCHLKDIDILLNKGLHAFTFEISTTEKLLKSSNLVYEKSLHLSVILPPSRCTGNRQRIGPLSACILRFTTRTFTNGLQTFSTILSFAASIT